MGILLAFDVLQGTSVVTDRHPHARVHKLPLNNANFLSKFSESLSTQTCCTRGTRMNGEDLLRRNKTEGYQNARLHARCVSFHGDDSPKT